MNMKASVITYLNKFVTIKGRASRSEFWWFILPYFLLLFPLLFIISFCLFALAYVFVWEDAFILKIFKISHLVLLLPTICMFIRRFHDVNISAWAILYYFLFLLGFFIIFPRFAFVFIDDFSLLVLIGGIVFKFATTFAIVLPIIALVFLFKKGTAGDNRFGADPLAEENPH